MRFVLAHQQKQMNHKILCIVLSQEQAHFDEVLSGKFTNCPRHKQLTDGKKGDVWHTSMSINGIIRDLFSQEYAGKDYIHVAC